MQAADVFSEYFPLQAKELKDHVSRDDIVVALSDLEMYREAAKLKDCHEQIVTYVCESCGYTHFLPKRCDLRICEECGETRHGRYVLNLALKLKELLAGAPKGYRLRIVTLTSPKLGVDEWGPGYHKPIKSWFNNLKKHRLIKSRINGGVGGGLICVETKYGEEGDFYFRKGSPNDVYTYKQSGVHVHLHCLFLSRFIRQADLSRAWCDASYGKAFITRINEVYNTYSAVSEASKYVYKPSRLGTPENYARYLLYTKKQRLKTTFGSFYKLDAVKRNKAKLSCAVCDESVYKDSIMDRSDAVRVHEVQRIPDENLLKFMEVKKPVVPKIVSTEAFTLEN